MRRRNAVRLGVPALIVTVLAIAALWRVGAPVPASEDAGARGPLTTVADLTSRSAIGRRALLERVTVREVTSPRTFWFGPGDRDPVFAVLDPDVRRTGAAAVSAGASVMLVGLVRPAPPAAQAMRQWQIDEATAQAIADRGLYLHVTEVR